MRDLNEENQRLQNQLRIALKALNRIAMMQSSEMDYTTDFYEFVKSETRSALREIGDLQ